MAMGNVIGSNVCNLLLILGLSTVIKPIKFQRETRLIEIPMCLIITIIFIVICNTDNAISKMESCTLMGIFALFILYTIFMGIKGEKLDAKEREKNTSNSNYNNISIIKNFIYVVLGVIGLKLGGDFTVDNAVIIAKEFNISEQIISLTILAIGTSLPELVTSVTAAIKGNSDIAIGNIIGSNIFNMLLIIGVASFINPITYNLSYNVDMIIMMFAIILLSFFPIIPPKNEMNRHNGIVYLFAYAIYLVILFNM